MTDNTFTDDELKLAAKDFMRNLSENAERLSSIMNPGDIGLEYFKAICNNDFDNKLYYGTAFGEHFSVPEEYETEK